MRSRVDDRHKGAGGVRPLGDFRSGLTLALSREIERQSVGGEMPRLAVGQRRSVDFGSRNNDEPVGVEGGRVGDVDEVDAGLAEFLAGQEGVGQGKEIVARVTIVIDYLRWLDRAVGPVEVGVKVALVETAGLGKGERLRGLAVVRLIARTSVAPWRFSSGSAVVRLAQRL